MNPYQDGVLGPPPGLHAQEGVDGEGGHGDVVNDGGEERVGGIAHAPRDLDAEVDDGGADVANGRRPGALVLVEHPVATHVGLYLITTLR